MSTSNPVESWVLIGTSVGVTGLLSFLAAYPASCTGSIPDGTWACTNFIGLPTVVLNQGQALFAGALVGLIVGACIWGYRRMVGQSDPAA